MNSDDFASATEAAEVANANPIETIEQDPILMERQIGRTRASVSLMSGVTVAGDWAAGDCQALRRLIYALIDIADGATASVDRAARQLVEMTVNNRNLRDQLRVALNDIDALRSDREVTQANYVHHTGELLAEITKLQAATPAPSLTPELADFQQKAIDATRAADEAFEEAKWKEGGRYLKLANTWIGLLGVMLQS